MVIVAATAMTLLAVMGTAQSGAPAATHTVIIKQMHFEPPQLTVCAGDTVEWKNEDIFSHSVTADDQSFDSGLIAPGHSWKTSINNSGTVAYHCRPHPNMRASLVISGDAVKVMQSGTRPGAVPPSGARSLKWRPPTSPHEIHPILVNFTAALLPLALLSDLLGRVFRQPSLHQAAWWMVLYEATITPVTVVAGWWWKHAAGPTLSPQLITIHQWLGTSAAALFIILAVWRWRIKKREVAPTAGYLAFALIAVLALVYQGSLGGAMAFAK